MDKAELKMQLRASARDMIPTLRERAARCDVERSVPTETVEEFRKAGFFKILQPAKWGGYELDPVDFYDVQMLVAEGCMSSAWILGVIAIHNWQMALFDDRAAQDVWGEDTDVLISSSYMPVGKVEWVDDETFKFSGQWGFSSGCDHCDWVFLGTMVPPKPGEDAAGGPPDMRTFLLPRSDYEIVDDWKVMGLKGTGSKTIKVTDAIVPAYRTHKAIDGFLGTSPGNAVNTAPVFTIPFGQIFPRAVSTSCIGGLKGAINCFVEKTARRASVNTGATADADPAAQKAVADAMIAVEELQMVIRRDSERWMEAANGGEPLTIEERVKLRYNASLVPQRCIEAVDQLFAFGGGASIYEGNELMRFFLDIHTARAHTANNPFKFGRNLGNVELGGDNTDFFL